jgi:hypothetical protein
MAAVRAVARGLSPGDLEQIRHVVAGGRRPKVMFTQSAGQVAGQVGQVVALTDPAVSEEWLVVRFGRDELPFSPADLAIAPRGSAAPKAAKADPTRRPAGSAPTLAASTVAAPPVPLPREETPVPAPASSKVDSPAAGAARVNARPAVRSAPPAVVEPALPVLTTADAAPVADATAERKSPTRRAAKVKPPASLTVTLAYADGEWTVGATQGHKALAKPYVIKAAEALRMVAMLDVPGVHEAVEEIVVSARTQAEQQAERLRAELAELEERLAELRDVR